MCFGDRLGRAGFVAGQVRFNRFMFVLALLSCSASVAQEAAPPEGTHEVTMRQSEIDKTLQEIEPHAREYPVHFASDQQRTTMQAQLMQILMFLDHGIKEYPDNTDLLLRDAVANGFGHNMGCRDCGEKAIAAYDGLLKL
jgi:hypothetical protein